MADNEQREQAPSEKPMTEEAKRAPGAWEGNTSGDESAETRQPSQGGEPPFGDTHARQEQASTTEPPFGDTHGGPQSQPRGEQRPGPG